VRTEALQEELGLTLFDIVGRRRALTSEGEEFFRHSRALLAQAEAIRDWDLRGTVSVP
jgi:DNA-binding transcriptional LysR family regulator